MLTQAEQRAGLRAGSRVVEPGEDAGVEPARVEASRRKWRTTSRLVATLTARPGGRRGRTTSAGAKRRSRLLGTGDEPVGAEVGHQRGRDAHRAVGLLVVLEQRDDRAREGERPRR